jgi:hypothetical protein
MKSFRAIRKRLHELARTQPDGIIAPPDIELLAKARTMGPEAEFNAVCGIWDRVELKRPDWIEAEIAALRAKLRGCRRRRRSSAEEVSTTLRNPTPAARLVAC